MSEKRIENIVNYLIQEAGKKGEVFDVFNEQITEEDLKIQVRSNANNLVLLNTNVNQKDVTTVALRNAVATL